MLNRFFRRNKPKPIVYGHNPDHDPIYITHAEDDSLAEDEMIIHTTIDPNSIKKETT